MRRSFFVLAATLLGLLGGLVDGVVAAPAQAQIAPTATITTMAGNGAARFAGDGGPAAAASLYQPRGRLAQGPDGSTYVADTFNNRVRRIAPDGTITTVAGNGAGRQGGDGGPATAASLHWPHDVLVDAVGVLYIADSANHRIRRVTPDGIIRTIAGTGAAGFNGDGIPATRARLNRPKALALLGTTLYFSDGDNNRIRAVDLTTGLIRTVAGNGRAGFAGDGGPATAARIRAPRALDVTAGGELVFADSRNNRVRWVGTDGRIRTIAGTGVAGFRGDGGPATAALLNRPRGLTLAEGDTVLYIADSDNARIRQVDLTTGVISTVVGNGARRFGGDGGPVLLASLRSPRGVTVDGQGRLLVADTLNNRVRLVTP